MNFKLILSALVLAMAPGLAAAQCSGEHRQQTAMTCAEGMIMDDQTGTCVPLSTS